MIDFGGFLHLECLRHDRFVESRGTMVDACRSFVAPLWIIYSALLRDLMTESSPMAGVVWCQTYISRIIVISFASRILAITDQEELARNDQPYIILS